MSHTEYEIAVYIFLLHVWAMMARVAELVEAMGRNE